MRFRLALLLLLPIAVGAAADCTTPGLKLHGMVGVESCDPAKQKCQPGSAAVAERLDRGDDAATDYTVAMMTSPWHLYDGENRILLPAEAADLIRPGLKKKRGAKRVLLIGSWTGVSAEEGGQSLAQQVSAALDGFPVAGMDGFLWLTPKGGYRTTQQAFTGRTSGFYQVSERQDVMMSLVDGQLVMIADQVRAADTDGKALMQLARGYDVFMLCRQESLAAYEEAAAKHNAIAAYNAALIHLELGSDEHWKAAHRLLESARDWGDRKAATRLSELDAAAK